MSDFQRFQGPIEKLIKRQMDTVDKLSIVLVITAALIIQIAVLFFPYAINTFPIVLIILLYLCTKYALTKNIEFEYSYFNGDIVIDKIIAQKKRKRIVLAEMKDVDIFGDIKAFKSLNPESSKIVYCNSTNESPESYFFITRYDNIKITFFFEPNEEMVKEITKRIPKKVVKGE